MKPNDMPTAPVTPATEIYPRSRDETKKASFWISQLFILLATVMGVYLASSQGFKQAIAYGEVQSNRSNYYLRQSLRNEIDDNLAVLERYMKGLESGSPSSREAPINLDMFVWDCLKNSSHTLETPSVLLRESRKFYREVNEVHQKVANGTFAAGYGKEQLQKLVDNMRKQVLPEFDKNLRTLRDTLKTQGVEVQ